MPHIICRHTTGRQPQPECGGLWKLEPQLAGRTGATNAGQEASVADGFLVSAESLSAGQGVSPARALSWQVRAAELWPELWERIM